MEDPTFKFEKASEMRKIAIEIVREDVEVLSTRVKNEIKVAAMGGSEMVVVDIINNNSLVLSEIKRRLALGGYDLEIYDGKIHIYW